MKEFNLILATLILLLILNIMAYGDVNDERNIMTKRWKYL